MVFTVAQAPVASQVASQTQAGVPSSPGSSPEHWTTKSFVGAALTVALVGVIAYFQWKRLMDGVRANATFRVVLYFSEATAAIILSIIASYCDVFKKSTYVPTTEYQPDWHVIFWASAWAAVAAYYCVVKLSAIATKEGEEFKSKGLSEELTKERAAKDSLTSQRDLLTKITNFARSAVAGKTSRLSQLISTRPVKLDAFVQELNPKLQVQLMMKLVHEFFRPADPKQKPRMRLALFMIDSAKPDRLSVAYAWDGDKEACFSEKSTDQMKIADPMGTRCEAVKCYNAPPGTIKIIPDCVKAQNAGEFEFLYAGQQEKVKSLVLYKHVFLAAIQPVAVVLMLVSSQADHFKREDEEQIRQFLDEMLTRIEMEWIVLELSRDLLPKREAA